MALALPEQEAQVVLAEVSEQPLVFLGLLLLTAGLEPGEPVVRGQAAQEVQVQAWEVLVVQRAQEEQE